MCREEHFTTWQVWFFPSLTVIPKTPCRYIGNRFREIAHSSPANRNKSYFLANTQCANRRPNTVDNWHVGHCEQVDNTLCITPYMVEKWMGGHSGAQLVQSGTHFVPKEQLRATRRMENYILKSAVFRKPPEKENFIYFIFLLSRW